MAATGGPEAAPFIALLEGGEGGEMHNEVVDYFYYAQIRTQVSPTQPPKLLVFHLSGLAITDVPCMWITRRERTPLLPERSPVWSLSMKSRVSCGL